MPARLEITSSSPPGRVAARSPLVQRLQEAGGFDVEPKQAWTPVAQFSEEGIDAVNLGPGATRYAHARDERVSTDELARTLEALQRFVTGSDEAVTLSPSWPRSAPIPSSGSTRRSDAGESGGRVIDFGVGDPREPTAPLIRQALVDGVRETMGYPSSRGLPELREAIAALGRAALRRRARP